MNPVNPSNPVIGGERTLRGTVVTGRGLAGRHLRDSYASLKKATGENLIPGSLNIVMKAPMILSSTQALRFDGGERLLWPATVREDRVWIYRWAHAPLHVLELLSSRHLRTAWHIRDGATVAITVDAGYCIPIADRHRLAWSAIWKGREAWVYRHRLYYRLVRRLSIALGAGQPPAPAFEST